MNQLSPEARRLIKLARRDDSPDPSTQRRVERSLGRRVALGAALTVGSTLVAKTAAGARVLWLASKIVGVSGAIVGAGWLVSRAADSEQQSETRPAASPAREQRTPGGGLTAEVERDAPPPPTVAEEPPVDREPPRSLPAAKKAQLEPALVEQQPVAEFAPLPSPAPDRLLAETTDLRRAQQALRAGDPAQALRLVAEQDQRHASGVLHQERAAVSIFALCESGQVARARSEAARFEERWPESALVARVRATCRDR